jgi:hypothetical protein
MADAPRPGAPRTSTDEQVELVIAKTLYERGPGQGHALVNQIDSGPRPGMS